MLGKTYQKELGSEEASSALTGASVWHLRNPHPGKSSKYWKYICAAPSSVYQKVLIISANA